MESENLWPADKIVCRVCLGVDERCCDIFNTYYVQWETMEKQILYCDMLSHASRTKIHPKDGLPPYMCRNCIMQLEDVLEFHLECKMTEKYFRRLLSVR